MSLTDDARLVVETIGKMRQAQGTLSVLPDGYDEACLRLANAYIEAGMVDGGGCPQCGELTREDEAGLTRWKCGCYLRRQDGTPVCSMKCQENQIAILTARLSTVSEELAEHKRRLMEQSAVLNDVRKSRDEYKRRLLNLPERSDNDDATDDC